VTGDTLVGLADGRRVPIADLVGSTPEVLSVGDDGRVGRARSDAVWRVGRRAVLRVRLASGRTIRATARHRLRGASGWVRVGDLRAGDRLALASTPARERTSPGTNADPLPREVLARVRTRTAERGPFGRRGATLRDTSCGGDPQGRFAASRETASGGARLLEDADPAAPASDDLVWDRVVTVEDAGEEDVFDLTVPGPASWLADGIVSHNSGAIEQDADVICFLYRKHYYTKAESDRGLAEVIVAKQRNGPTDTVRLAFLDSYMRFDNLAPGGAPPGSA
jgi:replicative DNA helicase